MVKTVGPRGLLKQSRVTVEATGRSRVYVSRVEGVQGFRGHVFRVWNLA